MKTHLLLQPDAIDKALKRQRHTACGLRGFPTRPRFFGKGSFEFEAVPLLTFNFLAARKCVKCERLATKGTTK